MQQPKPHPSSATAQKRALRRPYITSTLAPSLCAAVELLEPTISSHVTPAQRPRPLRPTPATHPGTHASTWRCSGSERTRDEAPKIIIKDPPLPRSLPGRSNCDDEGDIFFSCVLSASCPVVGYAYHAIYTWCAAVNEALIGFREASLLSPRLDAARHDTDSLVTTDPATQRTHFKGEHRSQPKRADEKGDPSEPEDLTLVAQRTQPRLALLGPKSLSPSLPVRQRRWPNLNPPCVSAAATRPTAALLARATSTGSSARMEAHV